MSNELKNHYGVNTSYLCYEGSLALNEVSEMDGYVASDFDIDTDEGCANVHTILLLESAHAVMEQQQKELEQLRKDLENAKALLSKFVPSNDYETEDEEGDLVERNYGGDFQYNEGSECIGLEVIELLTKLNQD